MKLSNRILILLAATILIAGSVLTFALNNLIPDKLVMPIMALLAMVATLSGLVVSSVQWEKGRLGNELLKEQFRLVASFLDHIQKNPNLGFPTSSLGGKVLIGEPVCFSAINYKPLEDFGEKDRFVVKHYFSEPYPSQLFSELNNEIIHNPFFPAELSSVLRELDTATYFFVNGYSKSWLQDEFVSAEMQFVLMVGSKKEDLDNKPLRIPHGHGHLRISDVLAVYKEFNGALADWLKRNHLDVSVNRALNPSFIQTLGKQKT
ncbi:MAG: hypothetical protein H6R05_914 [Burkholderiaceae bacterium]|nr:hypothetical protein [Burkholderiaceae bacterium]